MLSFLKKYHFCTIGGIRVEMSATHINYRHNPYTMKVTWENATEHDHTFFEIVLIVASSADHFVNGQQSSVSRGDIILLRPQDRHYFKITGNEPYQHRDIYITQKDMQDICNQISEDSYEFIMEQKMPFNFKLDDVQTNYIESFCENFDDIIDYTQRGKYEKAFFKCFCSHVVCLIYNSNLNRSDMPQWLMKFIREIKENKTFLTCSIDELIQKTGYSHTHFCRLFKHYLNTTFSQYITDYKIDYSLGLLQNKALSILEISSALGYDSTSYYITAFKKRYGITPHKYRISRL